MSINIRSFVGPKSLLLLVGMAIPVLLLAQPGSRFLWAVTPGGVASERTYCNAIDNQGNVYVTGTFRGTSIMGPDTLVASTQNMFLAKFDSSGNILWARQSGGAGVQFAYAVTTDRFNNVYMTGGFSSACFFGSDTLNSVGSNDVSIVKYDANGNKQWSKRAGGVSQDMSNTIASDEFGNVYIGGYYSGTAYFDSLSTSSLGNSVDVFLAKLNADGEFIWVKSAGGANSDQSTSIVTDDSCHVFFTGYFQQSIDFQSDTLSFGSRNGYFLAKYDSSGNEIWIRGGTGVTGAESYDVAVDSLGDAFITGTYEGGHGYIGSDTLNTNGGNDLFVARYDSQGDFAWAKGFGSATSSDFSTTITVTNQGLVYAGGNYQTLCRFGNDSVYGGNLFVAKYDVNGNFIHAASATGRSITGSSADTSGGVYVSGDFYQYGYFGKDTINVGSPVQKVFLSKLGQCGSVTGYPVCIVTVDSLSKDNIIVWEQQPTQALVDSFIVFRSTGGGNFIRIGAVDQSAISTFIDTSAVPDSMSYEYRIAMVDECNVRGILSLFHSTIFLNYVGAGLFNWTPYSIESTANTVASYGVYRDDLGTGNFHLLQVVSPVTLSYTDPDYLNYPNARYRIVVSSWLSGGNCNPSRSYSTSMSNVCTNILPVGVVEPDPSRIRIYPNPATDRLNVDGIGNVGLLYIRIMDALGDQRLTARMDSGRLSLDVAGLAKGVYLIQFCTADGKSMFSRRFIVE